jgi:histone-lysine N-methyltransferase SETD3
VRASGGAVSGVNAVPDAGGAGYGLVATRPLRAGERLIELPARCLLTYDDSGSGGTGTDPRLTALIAKVPEELWGGRLALALLAERAAGASSAFAPYVAALPVGFAGIPVFFGREALEAVDYPPVVEQVGVLCVFFVC